MMNRLGILSRRAASLLQMQETAVSGTGTESLPATVTALASRFLSSSAKSFASQQSTELMDAEIEHATGLEREQLEAEKKGVDMFHEAWLDAPFGTESNPVEVTSEFNERVVGVPDVEDDSTIWWGTLKAGEPPKQITEGGEFFVLKQVPSTGGH